LTTALHESKDKIHCKDVRMGVNIMYTHIMLLSGKIQKKNKKIYLASSVVDPDPGYSAFLIPGFEIWIRDGTIRIRNKHPGSATLLARPKRGTELHSSSQGLLSVFSLTVHVVAYTKNTYI
jgi:hypothetical protein